MAVSVSAVEKSGAVGGLGTYIVWPFFFITLRISDWTRTQKRGVCLDLFFFLQVFFWGSPVSPTNLRSHDSGRVISAKKPLPFQNSGLVHPNKIKHAGFSKSVFPACHLSGCIITRVSPSMMKFINRIGFNLWVIFVGSKQININKHRIQYGSITNNASVGFVY